VRGRVGPPWMSDRSGRWWCARPPAAGRHQPATSLPPPPASQASTEGASEQAARAFRWAEK
jgi:hypothetical protein